MAGRRVAVLIATTEHIDESLRGGGVAVADCIKLRDVLINPDLGGFDEVCLVVNESKSGIERELERALKGCGPKDIVLLLVSGRAVWSEGQLFFATVGTDAALPYSTAIPAMVLKHLLAQCPAASKLVLVDCGIGAEPKLNEYLGDGVFLLSATEKLTATLAQGIASGEADLHEDGEIDTGILSPLFRRALPDEAWQMRMAGHKGVLIAKAPVRNATQLTGDEVATPEVQPELLALLGFPDGNLDVEQAWQQRTPNDMLRVPIGVDENGQPVLLDIKTSPYGGMGPHGLFIGASDVMRADFLQTLVGGLAATHSSDTVNFALLDFSGDNTMAPLGGLPHVSTLLTGGDTMSIGRLKDALAGEANRRKELLYAGRFRSVWDYQEARRQGVLVSGEPLDPLPALMIVIDGFAELIAEHPDFQDMVLTLARLGKVLQIHLLLSSAQFRDSDIRWLDPFMAYRIAMRTQTASDSRAVFGRPDAIDLPYMTGAAILRFGADTTVRFTTATASRSAKPGAAPVFEDMTRQMLSHGPPAHQLWLPPLERSEPLDVLLPPLHDNEERGLCPADTPWIGQLKTPIGLVDKPLEQRRDLLWADFSGTAGHAVIVGGPQSGKSTLLKTLLMSMALTHTPKEAEFYCLDFGGALVSIRELPNVAAVAAGSDRELIGEIIELLTSLINDRKNKVPDTAAPHLFLVADGDQGDSTGRSRNWPPAASNTACT
ncbi:FtsK/SpoIIIE domain-containing protein [Kibdelosporangium philippinense]|uniref:FtsK/SpoIIIE domain-containing protein n=1 Tax=Kibdelosporangium philippinense TaxID=211113 RepID=UPI0027E01E1C|nr:FtsK/SpoIIIE domain-containing protein [Kibdelosporangium philippinense]